MPESHLIISVIKKITTKVLVYLFLGVNHPQQQNYINAHRSQVSVICPMELRRMFIQLLSVLPMHNKIYPVVSLVGREQLKAYVISFVVENYLPLSYVLKFTEFAKNLARDHKALPELKMNRTGASYKLVDGLNVYEHTKIVDAIKSYPFSINIDECTSNNHHKVFNILVSYFDEIFGLSVV